MVLLRLMRGIGWLGWKNPDIYCLCVNNTYLIILHLKLTFHAEHPPPSQIVQQELLTIAE